MLLDESQEHAVHKRVVEAGCPTTAFALGGHSVDVTDAGVGNRCLRRDAPLGVILSLKPGVGGPIINTCTEGGGGVALLGRTAGAVWIFVRAHPCLPDHVRVDVGDDEVGLEILVPLRVLRIRTEGGSIDAVKIDYLRGTLTSDSCPIHSRNKIRDCAGV